MYVRVDEHSAGVKIISVLARTEVNQHDTKPPLRMKKGSRVYKTQAALPSAQYKYTWWSGVDKLPIMPARILPLRLTQSIKLTFPTSTLRARYSVKKKKVQPSAITRSHIDGDILPARSYDTLSTASIPSYFHRYNVHATRYMYNPKSREYIPGYR